MADYQFGRGGGEALFPEGVSVFRSRKTGKVKTIYYGGRLLATLRPSDGYLALDIPGAERLTRALAPFRYRVVAMQDVVEFIERGRNLFAKHVVYADPEIRPGEEVIVTDPDGRVIAVGRSVLNGREMKRFKIGVAVKVRRGGHQGGPADEEDES